MSNKKNNKKPVKYKKAPEAPKRFKSAYMFFSTAKHQEIREQYAKSIASEKNKTAAIAKLVSNEWKNLCEDEREAWEEMARQDKLRFEAEKVAYTGPWKVPAKKRAPKHPDAPKRPMSAFLLYSNAKRASIRKEHPKMNNIDVSRELAKLWKDEPESERRIHIEKEIGLRQVYRAAMANWKQENEQKKREEKEDALTAIKQSLVDISLGGESEPPSQPSSPSNHGGNSQSTTMHAETTAPRYYYQYYNQYFAVPSVASYPPRYDESCLPSGKISVDLQFATPTSAPIDFESKCANGTYDNDSQLKQRVTISTLKHSDWEPLDHNGAGEESLALIVPSSEEVAETEAQSATYSFEDFCW
eukprot:CAMPEP_0118710666 /NCGR_PEP_ID=MMETSP0800-20121206/23539_1 /TAXON_ID=210618 ORGANISM="Striatella unipunctata, Strain CCMP2910" /NCGR_SAMPLE_ID=MMETSP0800 /ASSEMBLY_ACC=CAM_ASM_000638 /LENGTH=357 /DNA_ID=CAMNT_0006614935 /DNA_START=44 /DNA_END=1117 /DNA_ORIENTATION=-